MVSKQYIVQCLSAADSTRCFSSIVCGSVRVGDHPYDQTTGHIQIHCCGRLRVSLPADVFVLSKID